MIKFAITQSHTAATDNLDSGLEDMNSTTTTKGYKGKGVLSN